MVSCQEKEEGVLNYSSLLVFQPTGDFKALPGIDALVSVIVSVFASFFASSFTSSPAPVTTPTPMPSTLLPFFMSFVVLHYTVGARALRACELSDAEHKEQCQQDAYSLSQVSFSFVRQS
jgi:hypothetical protein